MGIFLSIIFVSLELVLLVLLLFKIKRYKSLTLKDTIIYPLLLVLTLVLLLIVRMMYVDGTFWTHFKDSFNDAIDIIKLSINQDIVALLKEKDFALIIPYYGAFAISFSALSSLTIYLIYIAAKNFNRILEIMIKGRELIILFGFNDDAKKMIKYFKKKPELHGFKEHLQYFRKPRPRMLVVLDSGTINKFVEEKTYLDKHHVGYVEYPYKEKEDYLKTIKKVIKSKKRKYTLITFFPKDKTNDEFSSAVFDYFDYLKEKNISNNVTFIMNVDNVQDSFIQNKIYDPVKQLDKTGGRLRTFNKYDLNSYLFNMNHSFAKHIHQIENEQETFIEDDCTIKDCDIHAYFIGFGKVNQALLRDVLIVNQFVEKIPDGKGKYLLKHKFIDVDVFEKEKKLQAFALSTGLLKYHKNDFTSKDYLDLPDDYASHINFHLDTNVESADFINHIYDDINERKKANKRKQINFFFISLGEDMYNSLIANTVRKHIDALSGSHSFYFVKKEDVSKDDLSFPNMFYMGKDADIFTPENVLLNNVYKAAKFEHFCYSKGKEALTLDIEQKWLTLPRIKQKSNLYSVNGLYFKRDLLNCSPSNYLEKYNPHNILPVGENDIRRLITPKESFEPIDVIAYSEHERWNAFEIACGVLPMKKSLFLQLNKEPTYDKDGNLVIKNQTLDGNYHLCIASAQGLVDYYELFKAHNLPDANVIGYDYDAMNNYINHYQLLNEYKK